MKGRGWRPTEWEDWVGTLGGIGLARGGGTLASAVCVLVYVVLPSMPAILWAALALCLAFFGTIIAYEVERDHGHDPPRFVLDEFVGMQFALIAVPSDWTSLVVAFVLFRLFDIVKPPPVHQAQSLRGGLGVMADDVVAGCLARLVLWVFQVWGL